MTGARHGIRIDIVTRELLNKTKNYLIYQCSFQHSHLSNLSGELMFHYSQERRIILIIAFWIYLSYIASIIYSVRYLPYSLHIIMFGYIAIRLSYMDCLWRIGYKTGRASSKGPSAHTPALFRALQFGVGYTKGAAVLINGFNKAIWTAVLSLIRWTTMEYVFFISIQFCGFVLQTILLIILPFPPLPLGTWLV